jgi:hypothetical protein
VFLELGCQQTTGSMMESSPPGVVTGDDAGSPNDGTAARGGSGGGASDEDPSSAATAGEAGERQSGTGGTAASPENEAGAASDGESRGEAARGGASGARPRGTGGKPDGRDSQAGGTSGAGYGGLPGDAGGGATDATSTGGIPSSGAGGATLAGAGVSPVGGNSMGGNSMGGAPLGGAPSSAGGTAPESTGGTATASTGGAAPGAAGGAAAGGASAGGIGAGAAGTLNAGGAPCAFDVTATTSPAIPTVGSVDWSTTLADLEHAELTYTLDDAADGERNRGGQAPADVSSSAAHTLLLGLKQNRNYTFHVEATSTEGVTCTSPDYHLTTGTLANAPSITRTATDASATAGGFIITTGGFGSTAPVAIVDADGSVVWTAPAPTSASRARFDYEARNLWVLAANAQNGTADVRSVSLDGLTSLSNPPGLERAHHDLVAMPGGVIATFVWSKGGIDQESDLVARSPDGSVTTLFHVGSNLYAGGPSVQGGGAHSYHCNSLAYYPADQSFTIGDRNPSSFVKVKQNGELVWQFGGTCSGAKTTACVPGSWQVNHGHQLLDDGTFLFFNNTSMGSSNPSNADEFTLSVSDTLHASSLKQWTGSAHEHSDTLGDVQRLPNGDTLVTFSNVGTIYELDPAWNVVQTLRASSFGYSEWRATLYGPPAR